MTLLLPVHSNSSQTHSPALLCAVWPTNRVTFPLGRTPTDTGFVTHSGFVREIWTYDGEGKQCQVCCGKGL